MKNFAERHVGALIAWIVVVLAAVLFMPDTSALVTKYGQTKIPSTAQSQIADTLHNKWGHGENNTRQVVVVFSNGNDKLTTTQKRSINSTIDKLRDHKDHYNIKSMLSAQDNAQARAQLISKDKTTELLQLNMSKSQGVRAQAAAVNKAAKTAGVKTYVTGSDILNDNFQKSTEDGLKKTEVIAAIFIFVVLVLVFRSPIVPLVSLGTVGVAMLASLSVVMNLVKYLGFPLSSFTQVFMVVVLFGVGTDYNILMYDQFKEELSGGLSAIDATRKARRIAGHTILFSGSSILIGFTALALAKFSIYQSAVGVAVGVAVLLAVLLTLNPFFMATMGKKMFWPTKNFDGGSRSKLWNFLSKNAVLRPILGILLVGLVSLPFLFTYNNNLNYDTLAELSDSLPAKKGFFVVQDHFSKGTAEPSTLYITDGNKKLDQEKYLKIIDRVTRKIQDKDGVKTVASATQPGGSKVSALYAKNQLKTVTKGSKQVNKGLGTINSGLLSAKNQIAASNMQSGLDGVTQLIAGTNKLIDGSNTLQSGTKSLASGATTLSSGANSLASGAQTVNSGTQTLASGASSLSSGASNLASGANTVNNGVGQINSQLAQSASSMSQLATAQTQIGELANQMNSVKSELAGASSLVSEAQQLQPAIEALSTYRSQIDGLMQELNGMGDLSTTVSSVKTSLTGVAGNDFKSEMANAQMISAAQSIIDDDTASAASKAAAEKIKAAATTSNTNLSSNLSTLQGVSQQFGSLSMPTADQIDAIKTIAAKMPSEEQLNSLQSEMAQLPSMLKDANALMDSASGLTAMSGKLGQLTSSISQLQAALKQLQAGTNSLASGATTLANGASSLTTGANTLAAGTGTLASGATTLASGTTTLANGATTLNNSVPALTSGLLQVNSGQKTMYTSLQGVVGQMQQLQSGLGSASDGLNTISKGVAQSNSYLMGLRQSAAADEFYIPTKTLHSSTFKPAIKQYMSSDKHTTRMTIVLGYNPSSAKAMTEVKAIQKEVQNELKGTDLDGATVAIGGQTATTADTHDIASEDFIRTAVIMLVGIGLALMFITRSILQPVYILGTLILAYFTSLSITRWVSGAFLGEKMLTWNTPFFAFVMLIALGVDYSIFLMMKYREFGDNGGRPSVNIVRASGVIGAVVISAAIILGGTFAALMPSGVLTLIQVALAVIIGLIILVLIIPILIPAAIHLTYDRSKLTDDDEDDENRN
ncbi:transport protein [Lacticaseibacillus pantheris DSM 15945 = JCM 12539 = NBRC 106106]|uniref:Transport protein n=1 Tax=Lacticaseibacillus pantheris DSM 15945 = JCM 12539 = NBRC 106106 TaxID=1423783 RepID=A0A0R1U288_9LACO|nr:MMPL family transporter [Lacticaseibacillus pantheris]KRL86708.1 transport protein [Lacticaseibacillus pantheris DSM 15945 = JCM 12539 = NBRC 106106]